MAFLINCTLTDMEYRGLRTGTGRDSGKPWMMLVLEDSDTQQVEISVPADLQGDVYGLGLAKGDKVTCAIRAVARADGNSYCQLTAIPELADDDGLGF